MALSCVQGKGECDGCGACGAEPRIICDVCGNACYEEYYQIEDTVYCEDCIQALFRKKVS